MLPWGEALPTGPAEMELPMTDGQAKSTNIVDEIRSFVPAEVTAVFLAFNANIEDQQSNDPWFFGLFVVLAVVCVFYSKYVGKSEGWIQPLVVSFVVFPAWALMIAYDRIDYLALKPFIPTAIILILGLLIPIVTAIWGPTAAVKGPKPIEAEGGT
jgi:hypothetical protein